MKLNTLYQLADREKISIYNYKMESAKARIVNLGNYNTIFIDYEKIKNSIDEKCTLAEELGHYYYDAFYPATCNDKILINKQEFKAKKWQFKTLVPVSELVSLFKQGYKYTSEIAEKLEVSEGLVKGAYEYYRENNMIECY